MTYDADGAMASRRVDYDFPYDYNSETIADTFAYDDQRRLSAAAGSSDASYTSYDPNGNLWAMTQGGPRPPSPRRAGRTCWPAWTWARARSRSPTTLVASW